MSRIVALLVIVGVLAGSARAQDLDASSVPGVAGGTGVATDGDPEPGGTAERTVELPATIDVVETHGLWMTRRDVLLRELPWRPGETVTPEQWALGLTRLWNAGLWSRIDVTLVEREGRVVAEFTVEERITLNQILRFSALPGLWWVRVGLTDTNFLSWFQEVGIAYERFNDQQGGMLWWKQPRLFDQRIALLLHVERLARPRFGFTSLRTLARAEVTGEVHDRLRLMGRLEAIDDAFVAPVPGFETGEVRPAESRALVAAGGVRFGLVETVRLRQRSWSLELRPSVGVTTDPAHPVFAQGWAELLAFETFGEAWNVALRVQVGVTSAAPAQHRFFIGGLDLVRGLLDSQIRTDAFALANLELRVVAFDSSWFALMPAAFVDAVLARDERGGGLGALSTGIGVRLLVPRLVGTGVRLDAAVPIDGRLRVEPSIGVFQFF